MASRSTQRISRRLSIDTEAADTPQHSQLASRHKACDQCKRRKVRCSGEHPCQHCRRADANCQYASSQGRLATVERRLAQSQRQVYLFERAWRLHLPNVDLDSELQAMEKQLNRPTTSEPIDWELNSQSQGILGTRADESITQPIFAGEYEYENADTLEWDETSGFDSVADGIASLSLDPKGSGYMGPQSGNALLRYLQSISEMFPVPEKGSDSSYSIPANPVINTNQSVSHTLLQTCIDWYFKYYHTAYPILHEGYFRAEFMGVIARPKDGSWPILLNIVAAIGAIAGPESYKHLDIVFFRKSCENLSIDSLQRGSLRHVQAFALISNYLQKRGKPNSGFTFLGIALNLALGIGLHREFSEESSSPFTLEVRRRVWWTLYIFDSGARLTFGRPSMELIGVNIRPPRNLLDHDLVVDGEQLAPARDHPTVVSSLIWQLKLANISNLANSKLLEKPFPAESTIISLDDQVKLWGQKLPAYFHADPLDVELSWFDIPRKILLWRSWHLRIVIARPFLLRIIKERQALDLNNANSIMGRCSHSAQECVLSICNFCRAHDVLPGGLVWYATYWLVTAVFVSVTCLVYDPNHPLAPSWRRQIQTTKLVLEKMAEIEILAKRAAVILQQIMDLIPQSPEPNTFLLNEPMRLEIADIWGQSWLESSLMNGSFQPLEQQQLFGYAEMDHIPNPSHEG